MVKSESCVFGPTRKPIGYKVAPHKKTDLRSISDQLRKLPDIAGCYQKGGNFLDAVHLLENVLFRAGYNVHPIEDHKLTETAGFTVPELNLVVLRESIYEGLFENDPFSRYTVIHEFSHIVLNHAVTLHRGAVLGAHRWIEDSEWQANNLAAEMMMPLDVVRRLQCKPILIMSECGVSAQAVQYRLNNLRTEGLI